MIGPMARPVARGLGPGLGLKYEIVLWAGPGRAWTYFLWAGPGDFVSTSQNTTTSTQYSKGKTRGKNETTYLFSSKKHAST